MLKSQQRTLPPSFSFNLLRSMVLHFLCLREANRSTYTPCRIHDTVDR